MSTEKDRAREARARKWGDDSIQFPRLLAEIYAAGVDRETMKAVAVSMDLTTAEVETLFVRAEKAWEKMTPVVSCPHCGGKDITTNMAEWSAEALDPHDKGNTATLNEHQCQSTICQGRSFWT